MRYSRVILFLLSVLGIVLGYGCAVPLATVATSVFTKSTATAVSTGVYDAIQDVKDKPRGEAPVPESVLYRVNTRTAKNAVLEVLSESGDTVDTASNSSIKTARKTETSSLTGRNEISVIKSVSLTRQKGLTKVVMKIDTFQNTTETAESKKESMEYKEKIRGAFFERLSKKIMPVEQAKNDGRK